MIKTGLLGFVFIDIHTLRLTTTDIFQTVIRFLNNQIFKFALRVTSTILCNYFKRFTKQLWQQF
jgi:hypothetical protein